MAASTSETVMPSLPVTPPKAKKAKKQKRTASTDSETNNDVLFAKLVASAKKVAERHTENAQKPALSDHEQSVNQFVGYLITQLKQVKQEVWFDITMAAQNLVHQYIVKGNNAGVVIACPEGGTWVFRGVHTFVIKIKKYP